MSIISLTEVHILWAQHQVHHTSEDFNMGVGIRQSMLQGWCGFVSTCIIHILVQFHNHFIRYSEESRVNSLWLYLKYC